MEAVQGRGRTVGGDEEGRGRGRTPDGEDECEEAVEEEEEENEEDKDVCEEFLRKMGEKSPMLTNPLEIRSVWFSYTVRVIKPLCCNIQY